MNRPLVSVVMATYQGDNIDHVHLAVQSVLDQSYMPIEFIIVIDGPVDSTRLDFFTELAKNKCVKVILVEINKGPANSRNLGIQMANGEYIAIMDADDVSNPGRIGNQLAFLVGNELDICSSYLDVIDSEGRLLGVRKVPRFLKQIRGLAPFRCPMHNPSVFGKASIFKQYPYDVNLRVAEDYDLWVRLLIDNRRLGNSEDCLVLYRQSRAAQRKRIGILYAKYDYTIKKKARLLLPVYLRPLAAVVSFGASAIRLMPYWAFSAVYRLRTR